MLHKYTGSGDRHPDKGDGRAQTQPDHVGLNRGHVGSQGGFPRHQVCLGRELVVRFSCSRRCDVDRMMRDAGMGSGR